jgi:hypothetical protein
MVTNSYKLLTNMLACLHLEGVEGHEIETCRREEYGKLVLKGIEGHKKCFHHLEIFRRGISTSREVDCMQDRKWS